MNKVQHSLLSVIQIGIIVCAVLISVVRLGVPHINGYEPSIETWFEDQGLKTEITQITLSVEGFTPIVNIYGLIIKGEDDRKLLALKRAMLHVNLWQSLVTNNIIIDQADLFLSKAALNTDVFNYESSDTNAPLFPPEIIQTLISLKRFTISAAQIDIVNQSKNFTIYNSTATLIGQGSHKKLVINSALLQNKGALLKSRFRIDLSQLLTSSTVSGSGFISIDIASLSDANLPNNLEVKGQLAVNNWINFDAENIEIVSQLNGKNTSLKIAGETYSLNLDSLLITEVNHGMLSIKLNNKQLLLNNVDLSDMVIMARTSLNKDVDHASILLAENIALTDISKLLKSVPKLKSLNKTLRGLKPKGQIKTLYAQAPSFNALDQASIRLQIKEAKWEAFKGIPSVDKVVLDIVANQQKLNALIRSSDLKILLADHYSHAFKVDRLTASVNANMNDDGLLLAAPDINIYRKNARVVGRMNLSIQNNMSPYMYLRLHAENADFKTVKPFLPQKLMDKDVLNWVVQSVRKADVKMADVLYSGRLENDVNFDVKNNGIFETALDIEHIDLHYDTQWPSLKSQQVNLTFRNYQLLATSQLASTQGLKATDLKFNIADLNIPQASLSLSVHDPLEKQWAFLTHSPIKNDIPYFSEVKHITGYAKTRVKATFPISNDSSSKVKFKVQLAADRAGFDMDKFDISLSDLSGDLIITQDKITMKPSVAKWFGQAIKLEITNVEGSTHINMKGENIDVASLLHNLPSNAKQHISGNSTCQVNAVFHPASGNKPLVSIEAHSALKGTAILLPPPFALSKEDTRHMAVNIDIYKDSRLKVHMSLDKAFDAVLVLEKNDNQRYDFKGGNIQFGEHLASAEIGTGLDIGGEITDLNIDYWVSYLTSDETVDTELSSQHYLALINKVDLNLKQLHVKNIEALEVKLGMTKVEKGLEATVQSSVAKGRFFIPVKQPKEVPIEIDLDVLDITLKEGLGKNRDVEYKTDDIPNLVFKSKQFAVNGKNFTNIHAEIESDKTNEFNLKKLSLQHKDVKLNASGKWFFNDALNSHVSHLKIAIKGKKFGQSLSELGFGASIENGDVDFKGDLTWPGTFWSLDFADAKGKVNFNLSDGYLLDVDPAEGRFVGLLSLSALPRRLTLDFSDFFKKGLQFDKIKGDFLIHDGSMWTDNLKMSGSVSDVTIIGRTGLKDKDYDQMITIIPQVRDALPVLGSIVAGSTVGWAMLLFQRLFKDPIDDSVSIKYKVTGHWDDPKIDLIEKPKPIITEEDDILNEN